MKSRDGIEQHWNAWAFHASFTMLADIPTPASVNYTGRMRRSPARWNPAPSTGPKPHTHTQRRLQTLKKTSAVANMGQSLFSVQRTAFLAADSSARHGG